MTPPRLIAFTGLAKSGKTSAAKMLWNHRRLSFAYPIKRMVAVLTSSIDKIEKPEELCGKTIREVYQTLGTEWGRRLVGEEIWVNYVRREIRQHLHNNGWGWGEEAGIAIDDLRFDNEAKMVKDEGGIIIHIYRPGIERMHHASEQGISVDYVDHCITAVNLAELAAEMRMLDLIDRP